LLTNRRLYLLTTRSARELSAGLRKELFAEETEVREANQTRTCQHALWQQLLAARRSFGRKL
jgi:hypothetical protein